MLWGRTFAHFFGKIIFFLLVYAMYNAYQQICTAISMTGNVLTGQLIASAGLIVFAILAYVMIYLITEKSLGYKGFIGRVQQTFSKQNAVVVLITFVALIGLSILENWLIPVNTLNQSVINNTLVRIPVFMAIMTLIVAPIVEELLFRKLLFNASTAVFNNKLSQAIAVLVSTVVFSFAHAPTNLRSFIVYASAGLVLALGYLKGNGLKTTLPVHFLNNLFSYLITLL